MTIGERIQELRKKKYMSQEELAERIEVSKQSVSKWELDKALPNVEKIIRLCDIFEISTDYLLRGAETPDCSKEALKNGTNSEDKSADRLRASDEHAETEGYKRHKRIKLIIGTAASIIVSIILLIASCHIIVYHNMSIGDDAKQDYIMVDRIYAQYTLADILYMNSEGEIVFDTVLLDANGVNEGDWIFGYSESDNPDKIKIKYRTSTCVNLAVLLVISLLISVILVVRLLGVVRSRKKVCEGVSDEGN